MPELNITKFVEFHKDRVSLLKSFAEKKAHGRLIYQVCFLGFESLANLLFQDERDSGKRFIALLSKTISKNDAVELYSFWRNSLFHEGFIVYPFTTLESWDDYDIGFLSYPEETFRGGSEYPPESVIAMYEHLINYFQQVFRNVDKMPYPKLT